jgi:hypothetical protein
VLGFRDALNKQKSRLSVPRPEVPESDKCGGIERFGQGVIHTSGGTKFDQLLRENESGTSGLLLSKVPSTLVSVDQDRSLTICSNKRTAKRMVTQDYWMTRLCEMSEYTLQKSVVEEMAHHPGSSMCSRSRCDMRSLSIVRRPSHDTTLNTSMSIA